LVTADGVMPSNLATAAAIPAFDGDIDYNDDVDGKELPPFVADSANLLDEQKVAPPAFGRSDLL
jgi:hypothetical protein